MKKLRNKITGEVNEFMIHKRVEDSEDGNPVYAPFDGDIDEWEDYNEKPKEYWYISDFGYVFNHEINNKSVKSTIEEMKSIGNYFLSREEAEKAVEKLKAWKRLKDFGCGFMLDDHFTVKFVGPDARKITSAEEQKSLSDSYKLLFGGEE